MSKQTTHEFSTKLNKDAKDSVKTSITLEWDVTEEQILKLAARAVIIEQQAIYRISGKIPATDSAKVSEILAAKKGMGKPMSKDQLVAKVTSNVEFFRATLESLGLSEDQIAKSIAKKFNADGTPKV